MRSAGNDGGVEAEQQPAQCANNGGFCKIYVHSRRLRAV